MIRKKKLISAIESLEGFKNPNIRLEQYTTDAISTADFIYFIGIDNQDIIGNIIIDLGAGTGRLGLASLLFGGPSLVAIEKDREALNILRENAENIGVTERILIINLDIEQIVSDEINFESNISELNERILDFEKGLLSLEKKNSIISDNDVKSIQNHRKICIMNPPFGVHKRFVDRSFLRFGMAISDGIYSIHLSGKKNRVFIRKFVKNYGWIVDSIHSQYLFIKAIYKFHKKDQKQILTDVYRIIPIKKQ